MKGEKCASFTFNCYLKFNTKFIGDLRVSFVGREIVSATMEMYGIVIRLDKTQRLSYDLSVQKHKSVQ